MSKKSKARISKARKNLSKDPTISERSRRYLRRRKRAGYMQVRVIVHREDATQIRALAKELRAKRV